MTKRLLVVLGTRPEAIKLAPVIAALKERATSFETLVCATDQHREMLDQALAALAIVPDIRLDVMQPAQTLPELTTRLICRLSAAFTSVKPDRVVVQGDTTTAFAAALSAYYQKIPVAHVEAGLRSGDRYSPFPEEVNRKAIATIADLHFAPTQAAADRLAAEGIAASSVHVTGNTVVDALHSFRRRLEGAERATLVSPAVARLADGPERIVLASCHRRETLGNDLDAICRAIARIARTSRDLRIVFPVHLNPNVRSQVSAILDREPNVHLVAPVSYPDFLFLLSRAALVLTDSGGIQEEAPSFGVPVLVLRRYTERPEAVDAGLSVLSGPDEDRIVAHAADLLAAGAPTRPAVNPYGDGHAAERIAEILARGP